MQFVPVTLAYSQTRFAARACGTCEMRALCLEYFLRREQAFRDKRKLNEMRRRFTEGGNIDRHLLSVNEISHPVSQLVRSFRRTTFIVFLLAALEFFSLESSSLPLSSRSDRFPFRSSLLPERAKKKENNPAFFRPNSFHSLPSAKFADCSRRDSNCRGISQVCYHLHMARDARGWIPP